MGHQHSREQRCIDTTIRRLHKKSRGRLISTTRNTTDTTNINYKNSQETKIERKARTFQVTRSEISREKTCTLQRKRNFNIETDSLLVAAHDIAIRTNYIRGRISKTLQNSRCRLCGDRGITINHIISEGSNLAQRVYKTRHDWVGKVIQWELCRKFYFDHTNKWYMHNLASVLENETHIILCDWVTNGQYNLCQTTRPRDSQ